VFIVIIHCLLFICLKRNVLRLESISVFRRILLSWAQSIKLLHVSGHQYQSRSQSQNYVTADYQSASLSWCQALIWEQRPIFLLLSLIIFIQLRICWCATPSLIRCRVSSFQFSLTVKVKVTLRLTVSQPVCLDVEPFLVLMTRCLLLLTITVVSLWGTLSDEKSGL
jgi:hypothetical protein